MKKVLSFLLVMAIMATMVIGAVSADEITWYGDNTLSVSGLALSELGVSDGWFNVLPVDMNAPGEVTVDLIAADAYAIGTLTVVNDGETVTVTTDIPGSYVSLNDVVVKWFLTSEELTAEAITDAAGSVAFGEAVALADLETAEAYLSVYGKATYRIPDVTGPDAIHRYYRNKPQYVAARKRLLELAAEIDAVNWPLAEARKEAAKYATVIDFEDGNYGFLGVSKPNGNAADATLEVVDFNGSKALQVSAPSGSPYVAINADGLLGENIANVRSIRAQYGVANAEDGAFWPVAGKVYAYIGEKNDKANGDWSVYMDFRNPNTVTYTLGDGQAFVAGADNYVEISKETDNYVAKTGGTPVTVYIDNIEFLDAEGNPLPLDLTAEYVPVAGGVDTSNLWLLKDAVEFEGFVTSGGAWAQNGFEMPEEIKAALVPGSVVEIEYASENGDMWIVMPWADAGWIRVGGGGNGTDYVNNAKNIAQIPYETFVEFLGNEDVSTWGAMMQCEASGEWQVFAVRVGQRAGQPTVANAVNFDGFTTSAGAWAQDGLEMPDAIKDALVPGSVVEIEFESANGDMWIVMPDATVGWSRVQQQTATIVGNKAYITYEQIAEVCGENKDDWGARMQCEASGDWSVFGVRVGTYAELPVLKDFVNFEGFTTSAGAWAQDGLEMTDEIKAALVPGAVVDIEFESASGDMWIVMPWAEAGWMRVAQGAAMINGSHAYVTYEQIVEACGEDMATWGAMMQCEASGDWSVFSVRVAQNANVAAE